MSARLDPVTDLIDVMPAPGAIANAWLPTFAIAATVPTFDNGLLFDVSAWDSWKIEADVYPSAGIPTLALTWYTGNSSKTQTIVLPSTTFTPVVILGRVLGPLLSVQLNSNLLNTNLNRIQISVSNRTRIYDAPYTPVPLGTVLATIPKANIASLGATAVNVPYYLGPAHLGAYIVGSAGASPGSGAMCRVHDDQAGANEVTVAAVNSQNLTSDLWVPSLSTAATVWKLSADNIATGTQTFAAALVAA